MLQMNGWISVNQTTSTVYIKLHSCGSMRRIGLTTNGRTGISIKQLRCWILLFLWHGSPTLQATTIDAQYRSRWSFQTPCQLFVCTEYHQYFWRSASSFNFNIVFYLSSTWEEVQLSFRQGINLLLLRDNFSQRTRGVSTSPSHTCGEDRCEL